MDFLKNWRPVRRTTDPRPGITIYPPVQRRADVAIAWVALALGAAAIVKLVLERLT